jgi:MGT family glycosyltransferase
VRVLQVIFDGGGNVPPQLAIARELVSRGHDVRVLGNRCQQARVEGAGAEFRAFVHAPEHDASSPETDMLRDWEARTPIGAFARMRDNLIYGPALRFARDVIAEVERRTADVVACDYLVIGGAIGAERAGVPVAILVHTVYPLPGAGAPPFGIGLTPAEGPLGRLRDAVLARAFTALFAPGLRSANAARRELGLEPLADPFEQALHADLVLVLTSPEFDFTDLGALPANVRYAGPVLEPTAAHDWNSPWSNEDPRPLVLASFSTTFQDQRDLAARFLDALAGMPARGLLTTGPAVDVSGLAVPENVEVREFVPHGAVLPESSLVVAHAGLGTVHAALAAGVPLVCIPDGRDQNDNAARVVAAGAGVRLRRGVSARKLRAAIAAALEDRSLRSEAIRLGEAVRRDDGAAATADALESLAAGTET